MYQDGKWADHPGEIKDGNEESWLPFIIEYSTGNLPQPDVIGQIAVLNDEHATEEEKEEAISELTVALTPKAGRGAQYDFETRMIKTAALCIAALEAIYAERAAGEPGSVNGI